MRPPNTIEVVGRAMIKPAEQDPEQGFEGEISLKMVGTENVAVFRYQFLCLGEGPVTLTIWKGKELFDRVVSGISQSRQVERGLQLALIGDMVAKATEAYLGEFKDEEGSIRGPESIKCSVSYDIGGESLAPILNLFD